MKQPDNFCLNGPTYKDQVYTRYLQLKNVDENSWDSAIEVSEKAHNERIRNIISPLCNLLVFLENRDKEEHKKLESVVLSENNIKLYRNCIEKLLCVPEQ